MFNQAAVAAFAKHRSCRLAVLTKLLHCFDPDHHGTCSHADFVYSLTGAFSKGALSESQIGALTRAFACPRKPLPLLKATGACPRIRCAVKLLYWRSNCALVQNTGQCLTSCSGRRSLYYDLFLAQVPAVLGGAVA